MAFFSFRKPKEKLFFPKEQSCSSSWKDFVKDPKGFRETEKVLYLPSLVFESFSTYKKVVAWCQKLQKKELISSDKIWLGHYYEEYISKSLFPKISIDFIDDIIGFGVFSKQKISANSFVAESTGIIKCRKKAHIKNNDFCTRYFETSKKFVVDAKEAGNFCRFINHSNNPNLELRSVLVEGYLHLIFIAKRDISTNEQLTYDYGCFFWKKTIPQIL